jgi:hypothetical protein
MLALPDELWTDLICPRLDAWSLVRLGSTCSRFCTLARLSTNADPYPQDVDICTIRRRWAHAEDIIQNITSHWPRLRFNLKMSGDFEFNPLHMSLLSQARSLTISMNSAITSLPVFSRGYVRVSVILCINLIDISTLSNVECHVILNLCHSLKDLSPLSNIHTLALGVYYPLEDLSFIRNVRSVRIRHFNM